MNLFNLMATLGIDTSEFEKGVGNSEKAFGGFGKKVGGIIAGLGIAKLGTDTIKMGIQTNTSLEQSGVAWTTLLGTQEASKKMLDDITQFAAKTPFSKMGVDTMAKQLNNAGFSGQSLFDQLTKFGDMGSAFGVQEDSLKEMVRQYAQVQQAGVAYTEDLNILQDRGIPIYKALAEATGTNVAEVKKMASEGKISADIYNKAIDSIAQNTTGAMEAQSLTFGGLWSTIKDGVENIVGKIMMPIFKALKSLMEEIGPVIDNISIGLDAMFLDIQNGEGLGQVFYDLFTPILGEDIATTLADIGDKIEKAFGWIIDNKDAIIAGIAGTVAAIKTYKIITTVVTFIDKWKKATEGMTIAQILLNAAQKANPIILIISLIAGIIIAIGIWIASNDELREKVVAVFQKIGDFIKSVVESIITFFTETIPKAFNNFVTFMSELPTKIGEFLTNAWNKFLEFGAWLINWVITAIPEFISNFITFFAELPEKIGYVIGTVIGKFVRWAVDLFTWVIDTVPKLVSDFINFLKELPGKAVEVFINFMAKVIDWGVNLVSKGIEIAGNFINNFIDWIKALPGRLNEWLINAISKVIEWGSDLAFKGAQAAKDLANAVVDNVKSLPGEMMDVGTNLVKGLWEGIKNVKDWILGKIKGFCNGITDGIKDFFGIHSPSKLFADEIGKYLPMGISVGFDKQLPKEIKDMEMGVDGMVSRITPKMSSNGLGNSQQGNIVFNQTINSKAVLTPYEEAQEAQNMLRRARWSLA